jgi:hypothetical protein
VVELANIFREHGPAYRDKFAHQMLPSHHEAMWAIEHCRTETLGGHVYICPNGCDEVAYRYHSCRNRHCPKCQGGKAYQWLEHQQDLLLPVPYFMLTFTLPEGLRPVARSHQTLMYDTLFRTSAAATQQLAHDPRFVGGQIGMVGVLHTWGRTLIFHPHVHYLIPAGGWDGQTWLPAREDFLLPVKALSPIFRAKFRDALRDSADLTPIPSKVWQQDWVVHCQPVGTGRKALGYLAPYVFRVAISNSRLVSCENNLVTFHYRDSNTGQPKLLTLEVFEFIHRFLQHVLPQGFVKVRYYGLLSPGCRPQLALVRQQLTPAESQPATATPTTTTTKPLTPDRPATPANADSEVARPDPTPIPAETDPLTPDQSLLVELEDEPNSPDEPGNTPTPPSSPPCCPSCGHPMRRCAILPPKGRSPP